MTVVFTPFELTLNERTALDPMTPTRPDLDASCRECRNGPCGHVVACLHCGRPLHWSEALTFMDNTNPGLGGCHSRCVPDYHAARTRTKKTP
jgi:hypothetical protein